MTTRPGRENRFLSQLRARSVTTAGVGLLVLMGAELGSAAPPHRRRAPDVTPPTQPEVAVTDVGATHVSFAWSSIEDGDWVWYTLFQDGIPILFQTASEEGTAFLLEPNTTYTFTVQARDLPGNQSPLSEPVVVTTAPDNPLDTIPPSVPTGLVWDVFDNEISLRWSPSSDNHDPPNLLHYDIFVNGTLADVAVGGSTQEVVFGVNGMNLVEITGTDTAGNTSAAASAMIPVEF
ncbi:MAG TPA: fibronectin type III domain-containing protein [Polyangiaceae bacterium]